jgi:hypothetical protein
MPMYGTLCQVCQSSSRWPIKVQYVRLWLSMSNYGQICPSYLYRLTLKRYIRFCLMWHTMPSKDSILNWPIMIQYVQLWLGMINNVQAWPSLTDSNFVNMYQVQYSMAHYAKYEQTWSNMAYNDAVWPIMMKDD